ncbi:MAG: DUF1127 domain-containing protein [Rhizobiaceae bacterium]
MTAIELSREFETKRIRYDFFGALQAGWRAFVAHRRERSTVIALARLSPRMLRDMGIDPERVYEAVDGSWDEIDPHRLVRILPNHERV